MTVLLAFLVLFIGFIALYYGAEWLVEGAVALATHFRISRVVAGVILVAFGTSAPELFVNSIAAVRGEASFALSNVSGSNLANLLLGFGACAIISQLLVQAQKFRIDFIFFSVSPIVLFLLMLFNDSTLPGWSLIPLIIAFAAYISASRSRMHADEDETVGEIGTPPLKGAMLFMVGIVLLYVGGELTVRQAIEIGTLFNISEAILGLTVVALGTSIPDIAASIVAARANENEIAVGNLLGSNIFNVLFVIPVTLLFSLLTGSTALRADSQVTLSFAFVVIMSLLFFFIATRTERLQRPIGYMMVGTYFGYMLFRVIQAI